MRAFQQALSEEGGGKVITVDANPKSAALFFSDSSYIIKRGTGIEYIETILGLCQKYDIKLVVPCRDEEIPVFAGNIDRFREIGVRVMVPDLSVVRTCQDKRMFIDFCIRNGFSVPETYNLDEVSSKIPLHFPLFIRGRFGKGSRSAFKVNTKDELDNVLKIVNDPIVQEYVDADEYSVDLLADFNGKIISVVPRQRITVLNGESIIGKTSKNYKIIDECIRLAQAIGLTGHNIIQCFLFDNKVLFIEVNTRFGGGVSLSFASGSGTLRYLIQMVKGIDVQPHIGEFKDNYLMIRYLDDFFLEEEKVKTLEKFDPSHTL